MMPCDWPEVIGGAIVAGAIFLGAFKMYAYDRVQHLREALLLIQEIADVDGRIKQIADEALKEPSR